MGTYRPPSRTVSEMHELVLQLTNQEGGTNSVVAVFRKHNAQYYTLRFSYTATGGHRNRGGTGQGCSGAITDPAQGSASTYRMCPPPALHQSVDQNIMGLEDTKAPQASSARPQAAQMGQDNAKGTGTTPGPRQHSEALISRVPSPGIILS